MILNSFLLIFAITEVTLLNYFLFIINQPEKARTYGHLFPDILFECEFYFLIVEIDEHKHRGANYQCDEKRMYDVIAKLGMPCIFIRYNPDSETVTKMYYWEKKIIWKLIWITRYGMIMDFM